MKSKKRMRIPIWIQHHLNFFLQIAKFFGFIFKIQDFVVILLARMLCCVARVCMGYQLGFFYFVSMLAVVDIVVVIVFFVAVSAAAAVVAVVISIVLTVVTGIAADIFRRHELTIAYAHTSMHTSTWMHWKVNNIEQVQCKAYQIVKNTYKNKTRRLTVLPIHTYAHTNIYIWIHTCRYINKHRATQYSWMEKTKHQEHQILHCLCSDCARHIENETVYVWVCARKCTCI